MPLPAHALSARAPTRSEVSRAECNDTLAAAGPDDFVSGVQIGCGEFDVFGVGRDLHSSLSAFQDAVNRQTVALVALTVKTNA